MFLGNFLFFESLSRHCSLIATSLSCINIKIYISCDWGETTFTSLRISLSSLLCALWLDKLQGLML